MNLLNYTVFDVETANRQRDSICSLGYIRVEDGQIVDSKQILINPETDFDYFNIKVHGITPQMVAFERKFPEVWTEIKPFFSNTVLVAHNARSMDLCALVRTLDRYGIEIPKNDYICTLELARKLFKKDYVGEYKLNVLCDKFNVPLELHHNSLEDAKACYGLLNYFMSVSSEIKPSPYVPSLRCEESTCLHTNKSNNYSEKTIAMQELQGLISNIISDNIITVDEANSLLDWMNSHSYLEGFYPYDKIFSLVDEILSDGIIEKQEESELLDILDAYINPKTTKLKVNVNNKVVCLSGEFEFGPKKEVEEYFISKGAKIADTITKKVDILVLGECGSIAWKFGNYGTKYEKVQQLVEKGNKILVYKENDIIPFLENKIDIDKRLIAICERITEDNRLMPNKIVLNKSLNKNGDPGSLFIQIVEMSYPDMNNVFTTTSVLRIPANNISEIYIGN
ncbi:MAG: hypothetical protein J5852_08060, partial [Clostridia bacterium]|nr:hypothetical protein [Clostridia bacterium]